MSKRLIFESIIRAFPPSVNSQLKYGKRQAFISKEYRQFKNEMALYLRTYGCPMIDDCDPNRAFDLHVSFYWSKWVTKKGNIAKIDVSNRYKAVEDSIFSYIGVDDSRNFNPSCSKELPETGDKYMFVKLFTYLI